MKIRPNKMITIPLIRPRSVLFFSSNDPRKVAEAPRATNTIVKPITNATATNAVRRALGAASSAVPIPDMYER